jgi:hypothetical protein
MMLRLLKCLQAAAKHTAAGCKLTSPVQCYDAIHAAGGMVSVNTANINKSMMQYMRNAGATYQEGQEKRRQETALSERKKEERKRAADQVKVLKAKIGESAAQEANSLDREIAELSVFSQSYQLQQRYCRTLGICQSGSNMQTFEQSSNMINKSVL